MAAKAVAKKKRSKKAVTNPTVNYGARIKVIGIGGGGSSAVSRMRDDLGIRGVEFIAINTDAQDLDYSNVRRKIYIGKNLTKGLGTGMNPDIGRQAAEENRSEIAESLKGADLIFLTFGAGGGTGSGAGPVIAEVAKETGALTIAVVTKPFAFEGAQRSRIAQEALVKLKDKVDTLIVVPNDHIFSLIKKDTPIIKAFEAIDDVLRGAVAGISELISNHGIINVDFADVRAVMQDAGPALIGVGYGTTQERAITAVNQAVNSPLLEIAIDGARSVLFAVAGGRDLKMTEINEAAKVISGAIDPSAKVIFGAYYDKRLKPGQVKITVIATGFNGQIIKNVEATMPSLFSVSRAGKEETSKATLAGSKLATVKEYELNEDVKSIDKKKEKKEEDDKWDIPAFLRKKR